FSSRRRHTRFSRDWSSDVCSSDLGRFRRVLALPALASRECRAVVRGTDGAPWFGAGVPDAAPLLGSPGLNDATIHLLQACVPNQIGRASCREREYVSECAVTMIET